MPSQKKSILSRLLVSLFMCVTICSAPAYSNDRTLIFPIPQELSTTGETFALDETIVIAIPKDATPKDISLAKLLVKELSNKYGIALKITSVDVIPVGRKVIVMGTYSNSLIKRYCSVNGIRITKDSPGKEGYVLRVSNDLIVIAGSDDQGAFYGLQSLRQLVQAGKGKTVQGIKVRDWPRFPFRGIRLYVPGPDNIAFFKRFMSDFMALYKYNKVIIEFNCMRLDKHPEVNTGWQEFVKYMQYTRSNSSQGLYGEEKNSSHYDAGDGFIIEKDVVKEIVKMANDNFLEVIPEIPSLTHAYYLLTKHPELAEYPNDTWPDTYCPSNPKSYELMFDVYDEYVDVIKPKMVHIGHDEWWGAPIGVCPRCRNKDYSKLYAEDVVKIHKYFADKGIKIAMWGDYLLESVREKGTQKRTSSTGVKYETPGALPPQVVKQMIPKDILIFNWFWSDEAREQELKDYGFQQLFGNFEPNIGNWDERTKKLNPAGGAPSSWAMTNEFNFGKDLLLDFIGCANLLWSKHTIKITDLPPYVWEQIPSIRASLKAKKIPSEDGNQVEPVDISAYCNLSKNDKFFGIDLRSLKTGDVNSNSITFKLSPSAKSIVAVGNKTGTENPLPGKVENISINEDVSSLIFLHASALPSNNPKAYFNIPSSFDSPDMIGRYEIVYEDGFKDVIPLQYAVNILEWNPGGKNSLSLVEGETGGPQNAYCYEADPINCSTDTTNIKFFSYEWVNKRFGKKVKEVNIYGSDNFQALQHDYGEVVTKPLGNNAILLAGITKVKKREPYKPKSK